MAQRKLWVVSSASLARVELIEEIVEVRYRFAVEDGCCTLVKVCVPSIARRLLSLLTLFRLRELKG
jgi:hypothetical protein